MTPVTATTGPEETRLRIVEAAAERFQSYGYTKTTMAEIADDLDMSAANLYRFFDNKEELLAACCDGWMSKRVERLREAARQKGKSAGQRLEDFVLANLRYSHEMAANRPKVNELVETMTLRRPDLVHDKIKAIQALLSEILAHGNETGEFEVDDVAGGAASVHAAIVLFEVPIFIGLFPLKEFEHRARAVVALLIRGLRKR